jgi:hypothetical protein
VQRAAIASPAPAIEERAPWRAVVLPREHGGWGLTLEPVLLGLLVAWSVAGLALGVAAFTLFLLRTPLKSVLVDVRRRRWLPRSRLAFRICVVEGLIVAAMVAVAVRGAGWGWAVPVLVAAPFVGIELRFDARSRSRRLVPELCGAIGISGVVAAIVIAGGGHGWLAASLWLILTARAVGSIPFVRVQIMRLHRGDGSRRHTDLAQLASVTVAALAVACDRGAIGGALGIAVLAALQVVWTRRAPVPARRLGLRQMAAGLALVAVTAAGVLL